MGAGDTTVDRGQSEAEKAVLLEVASEVAGTLDQQQLLQRVQRCTARALGCDAVVVTRMDDGRRVFRILSHHGLSPELVAAADSAEFPAMEPAESVLRSGAPFLANDIDDSHWLRGGIFALFTLNSVAAVQLSVHGRYFGSLIAVNHRSRRSIDARQIELMTGIARQLAVALEVAELYHNEQENAEISSALAQVAKGLIAALDTPATLSRLCSLAKDELHADFSETLIWSPRDDCFAPIVGCGHSAEQWEIQRALRFPAAMLAFVTDPLARDDVVAVSMREHCEQAIAAASLQLGVDRALYVALRREGRIVGLQIAGRRAPAEPFTGAQLRLARGIAQLGSIALAHARLVEELESANRLKSDFLANMSHELRTPLNVILGYAELLSAGDFGGVPAEQREVLQRIERHAHQLREMIDATLDVSRLESGKPTVELTEVSLAEILEDLIREREEWAGGGNVPVVCQLSPSLAAVRTDALKLRIILKNLLGNALKFTEHGSVQVRAQLRDGGLEIEVADTGIGIAPEILPVIFESFRQGDGSSTRRHGGVGLGLHLVKRLTEALGGRVTAASEVGLGSTFRLWLPSPQSPISA